ERLRGRRRRSRGNAGTRPERTGRQRPGGGGEELAATDRTADRHRHRRHHGTHTNSGLFTTPQTKSSYASRHAGARRGSGGSPSRARRSISILIVFASA